MRFINGLAVAQYDENQKVVQVNFNGEGDTIKYRVAIQVALDMAATYQVNRWVFIKNNFRDMDSYKFLAYLKEWMKPVNANDTEMRYVQVQTKIQAARKMNMLLKYNDLYDVNERVNDKLRISVAIIDEKPVPVLLQKIA